MEISKVLEGYEYSLVSGSDKLNITRIDNDSRLCRKGSLFIAEVGYTVDGHDFIEEAINNGASAIIVEKDIKKTSEVTIIKVKNSGDALAYSLAKFNNYPWKKLSLTGITGTNGKTSTNYYIKSILEENKNKVGIIGTMGAIINNEKVDVSNTTPNALVINDLINKMVDKNIDYCVMEVSSHALSLNRVAYMDFDLGIFTNLAKDHLDYHKTVENYFLSKLELFKKTKFNIINIDDEYGKRIIDSIGDKNKILTYGLDKSADIYAKNIKLNLNNVEFDLVYMDEVIGIKLNTPGEFSVYNALAAAAFAYFNKINITSVKKGLEAIEGIKGRFEVVPINKDYSVIIDFAHTAEGLKQVLKVIDEFAIGRKIVVFGAGGNRDRSKRPEMGEVVGEYADISIVTSDNPRNEEPENIIDDIIVGIKNKTKNYIKIIDRIEAIKYAVDIAKTGDVILLAGKGHETYTIIKDEVIPCDERQIVLDYLSEKENH